MTGPIEPRPKPIKNRKNTNQTIFVEKIIKKLAKKIIRLPRKYVIFLSKRSAIYPQKNKDIVAIKIKRASVIPNEV